MPFSRLLIAFAIVPCLLASEQPASAEMKRTPGTNTENYDAKIQKSVGRLRSFSTVTQKRKPATRSSSEVAKHLPEFKVVKEGDSSPKMRNHAISQIPFKKMTAANRSRTAHVIENLSIYRRLPSIKFEIEQDTHRYFVTHPDVAVSIWRALGISKIQLWQTGAKEYECEVGDGTLTIIDFVHSEKNQQIVYCDGAFSSPFLVKPIKSKCVMRLTSTFEKRKDGREFVTQTADVFVAFPSSGVEAAAKLISPVSNMIADRNFREVSLFLHTMYMAMTVQPGWVEDLTKKMDGVLAQRPKELMDLTIDVYVDARKRREQQLSRRVHPSDRNDQQSTQPTGKPLALQPVSTTSPLRYSMK